MRSIGGRGKVEFPARAGRAQGQSVREDWFAGLSEEKHQLFDSAVAELEAGYQMLSVALDEAFALRDRGELVRARQEVAISAELLDRLAARLLESLKALKEHGRNSGKLPLVAPLNPDFYRGETACRIAFCHRLLHRLLVTRRSRFLRKLRALAQTVEALSGEFRAAAEAISEGTTVHPGGHWQALEYLHYDLNTCLRETIVVLKSFLHLLPAGSCEAFRHRLFAPVPLLPRRLRHRFSRVST